MSDLMKMLLVIGLQMVAVILLLLGAEQLGYGLYAISWALLGLFRVIENDPVE